MISQIVKKQWVCGDIDHRTNAHSCRSTDQNHQQNNGDRRMTEIECECPKCKHLFTVEHEIDYDDYGGDMD